jgi:hypothetical protein
LLLLLLLQLQLQLQLPLQLQLQLPLQLQCRCSLPLELPVLSPLTQTPSFRPKAAHLPPQWRNLLLILPLPLQLQLPVFSPLTKPRHFDRRRRICRRGGEICCRQCHPGTHLGSGSTVLIPGRIVDVALNFR